MGIKTPRSRSSLILTCAQVGLVSAAIFISLAISYNSTGILTGEEASVSFRDVFFLPERVQHNFFATNLGAHFLYAFFQNLSGTPDLFYGRIAKCLYSAVSPALLTFFFSQVVGLGLFLSALTGMLFSLLPGVFVFAPIATEYGLEVPTLVLSLLLGFSRRLEVKFVAAVMAGFSAIIYGPGFVAVGVCLLQSVFVPVGKSISSRVLTLFITVFGIALILSLPSNYWINESSLFIGGGNVSSVQDVMAAGRMLVAEITGSPRSYYYFSDLSVALTPLIPLLSVAGYLLSGVQLFSKDREKFISLSVCFMGLIGSICLYILSGRLPGIRRGEPILLFVVIGVGYLAAFLGSRGRSLSLISVLGLVVAVSYGVISVKKQKQVINSQAISFPRDFPFDSGTEVPIQPTIERFGKSSRQELPSGFEPDRTLTILSALYPDLYSRDYVKEQIQKNRLINGLAPFPF